MLSISNAYAGKWLSNYHDIVIQYNDKVWSVAEQIDSSDETLFGLYDKGDGSSFLLRVEFLEHAAEIEDAAIEEALAETLRNADSDLKIEKKYFMDIAGKEYRVIDYIFKNKYFGVQRIRHAFIKQKEHVLMLMLSWPLDAEIPAGKQFPTKHLAFIEGLIL